MQRASGAILLSNSKVTIRVINANTIRRAHLAVGRHHHPPAAAAAGSGCGVDGHGRGNGEEQRHRHGQRAGSSHGRTRELLYVPAASAGAFSSLLTE